MRKNVSPRRCYDLRSSIFGKYPLFVQELKGTVNIQLEMEGIKDLESKKLKTIFPLPF